MNLVLKPAATADAADLFAWRNDPLTRAQSRNHDVIAWDEHCRWLGRVLDDAGCLFLVAWQDGARVGMVRFNHRPDKGVWEISIGIAPAAQGRGLGRLVLGAGVARLRDENPGAVVLAAVLPGNRASERLFLGAGFVPVGSDEDCRHFLLGA
ncbi:MAG: GNAT family N-acetyltransferase [Magnetospirillum gryphiswaldense]|nr:GNAT family N-acetyltransferase [Magnetospirillum gryphiswaldense]